MNNFTGVYKKIIAGIGCTFFLLYYSHCAFAIEAAPSSANQQSSPVENSISSVSSVKSPAAITTASNSTENITAAPISNIKLNSKKQMVSSPIGSSASQLASLIGGLVLILALIYALAWFVKRFAQGGFLQNPTMKIVSAMPLGTRERLMLIDVGGKQILLGVTAAQINTLHVFDEPVVQSEKNQPGSSTVVGSDFSQKLMAVLQNKGSVLSDSLTNKNSKP